MDFHSSRIGVIENGCNFSVDTDDFDKQVCFLLLQNIHKDPVVLLGTGIER